MDIELELKKMLDFIYACNADSNHEKDLSNQTLVAENYLKRLKTIRILKYILMVMNIDVIFM